MEFAPPAGGKGKSAAGASSSSSSTQLPTPQQQQQQQRRDSSASQQGRVTFVFPAQYLVTVAQPPPSPSGGTGNKEALSGRGMTSLVSPVSSALEEVLVS